MTPDDFKAWRKAMGGISQKHAGRLIGRSARTINSYEKGDAPIPVVVQLACSALLNGHGPCTKEMIEEAEK